MEKENFNLKYRKKITIIFIEYFVFALFFQLTFEFLKSTFELKYFSNFLIILFASYLIYFSLFEFLMNRTLIMWLFKVELDKEKKSNIYFILYTISSVLDRTIFGPFHMLLTILNYENLLLCEKLSGIKWKYSKAKNK